MKSSRPGHRRSTALLWWGLVWLLLPAPSGRTQPARTAAWVIRYDLDRPAEIDRVCAAARTAGLDHLLVQVRGRADAFYQSGIAPRPESLAGAPADFDPLARIISACRPVPIQAWLNVYYLWGGDEPPTDPAHPGRPGAPWILADDNGRSVAEYSALDRAQGWIEGIYADPASPEYRKLFTRIITELLNRYPVSGIHLDFLRYPGPAYGQTGRLGREFEAAWGIDPRLLPARIKPAALAAWLNGDLNPADRVLTTAALFWADLRAQQVTALLRHVRRTITRLRPRAELSAAIYPDPADAFLNKGQDWPGWMREGLIDALYPMAYFGPPERVAAQLRSVSLVRGRFGPRVRLWAGLGAYIKEPEEIGQEAGLIQDFNYHGLAIFSLGHLLRQGVGLRPYQAAVAKTDFPEPVLPGPGKVQATAAGPIPVPTRTRQLERILVSALAGATSGGNDLRPVIRARLAELETARAHLFPEALALLATRPVPPPAWMDLEGIFRYVDPLDPSSRAEEQQQQCDLARRRLLAGENFAGVAKDLSQGGSRYLGGVLPRRYLADDPVDRCLDRFQPGQVSPVIRVPNGYWCYRVQDRGRTTATRFKKLAWPARRLIFKRTLARLSADGPRTASARQSLPLN